MSHAWLEKNSALLLNGIILVIAIGGIVGIAPLLWVAGTAGEETGKAD